jgi:hypothetical protein
MIPLIYILPTDDLYTSATGIVTEITPQYSHYRHAIQIEFKYNLDEFFYLEIYMSELDQPQSIALTGYYSSSRYDIDSDIEEYTLVGKKVGVKISRETILGIVNNIIDTNELEEGIEIDLKILQDKTNIADRPHMSSYALLYDGIEVTINGVRYEYTSGDEDNDYEPTLASDTTLAVPDYVDGIYSIFNLSGQNDGLSFVAIPPHDFNEHFLFREKSWMRHANITDGAVTIGGNEFFYNNGAISANGSKVSMHKFLEAKKDTEEKQYIFNAARDKNLYSEISLLWPAVKHDSMTVYDFGNNTLIRGRVDYYVGPSKGTGEQKHHIHMSDCVDFFGRIVDKEFIFEYSPIPVLNGDKYQMNNASEYGRFFEKDLLTGDITPIITDASHIDIEDYRYMNASNNNYAFSISIARAKKESSKMKHGTTTFKIVSSGDAILPSIVFDTVNFDDNKILFKNGTLSFMESTANRHRFTVSLGTSVLGSIDMMSDFCGVEFNIPPYEISVSNINITNFNDYVMLCRMVEQPTYGISGVRKGTNDLKMSVMFRFQDTDIVCVYNEAKDKIYYINYNKKETVDTTDNMPYIFTKYLSSINERSLKEFLTKGAISQYTIPKTSMPMVVTFENGKLLYEEIVNEIIIDNNNMIDRAFYTSSAAYLADEIIDTPADNRHFIPRRSSEGFLRNKFESVNTVYRQVATGLYSSTPCIFKSVSVDDSSITYVVSCDNNDITISVDINGGPLEFKKSIKRSIVGDTEYFDHVVGLTVTANSQYDAIYQSYGTIVLESSMGTGFVLNYTAIEKMIATESFGVYGTFLVAGEEDTYIVQGEDSTTVSLENDNIIIDSGVIQKTPTGIGACLLLSSSENGVITDSIPGMRFMGSITPWDDGSMETEATKRTIEFTTDNGYILKIASEENQYVQIKE